MRNKILLIPAFTLLLFFLFSNYIFASPENNPIYATIQFVEEKIQSILNTIESHETENQSEFGLINQRIDGVEERLEYLESLITPSPQEPNILFEDSFNGSVLNTEKWDAYGNGGNILLSDGLITLSANDPSRFPFVQTKSNPFPMSGNFVFEWKMKYLEQKSHGNGLAFGSGQQDPDSYCNALMNYNGMQSGCNSLGGVWSSTDGFLALYTQSYIGSTVNLSDWHVFYLKCDYLSEQHRCSLYIEDLLVGGFSNPQIYMPTPTNIWFGHPDYSPTSDWSSFQLDYIKIYTN